ncbi:MAG: shikimate dehydrogenase [bacterium]
MEKQKDADLFDPPFFAGIFGCGIKYSLSPLIHSAMSKLSGANLCYGSFDISPVKFIDAFNGFKILKMKGANITQPYKTEVLKYVDSLSDEAETVCAVNTVNMEEDGSYRGYNTDIAGFIKAVNYEFKTDLKGKRVAILGAGGASRAILYALIKEGAEGILIINRGIGRASELKKDADLWKMRLKSVSAVLCSDFNLNDISNSSFLKSSDIVVNTITPSDGSIESVKQFISGLQNFSDKTFLMDISYSPRRTQFLNLFEGKSSMSANGLSMLFFQAIESFYIWTGKRIDFNVLKEALRNVF